MAICCWETQRPHSACTKHSRDFHKTGADGTACASKEGQQPMRSDRLEVEEIHEATARLWEAMFEDSLEYLEEECESAEGRFLTGSIQVTGAWDGAVVLRGSFNFARKIAQLMLGLDDAGDEEICDAMGELTNLTSGAI